VASVTYFDAPMNVRWFTILLLCLFLGCQQSPQDDQYMDRLADTYAAVVNCKEKNKNIDSAQYQQRLEAVLKQHGYTKQVFQREVEDLCADPVQFHAFSDLALKKIQQHKP
jgi:hypothetical protein